MLHKKGFRFALISLVILTYSCGRDEPCSEASACILRYISFPDAQTDSIVIRKFSNDSAFDILVDSVIITKNNSSYQKSNDTLDIINSATGGDYTLNIDYDYEIYLPNANKLFKISNITQQQTYFRAVPYYKRECVNPIKSYLLNGQLTNGDGGIIFLHN